MLEKSLDFNSGTYDCPNLIEVHRPKSFTKFPTFTLEIDGFLYKYMFTSGAGSLKRRKITIKCTDWRFCKILAHLQTKITRDPTEPAFWDLNNWEVLPLEEPATKFHTCTPQDWGPQQGKTSQKAEV